MLHLMKQSVTAHADGWRWDSGHVIDGRDPPQTTRQLTPIARTHWHRLQMPARLSAEFFPKRDYGRPSSVRHSPCPRLLLIIQRVQLTQGNLPCLLSDTGCESFPVHQNA